MNIPSIMVAVPMAMVLSGADRIDRLEINNPPVQPVLPEQITSCEQTINAIFIQVRIVTDVFDLDSTQTSDPNGIRLYSVNGLSDDTSVIYACGELEGANICLIRTTLGESVNSLYLHYLPGDNSSSLLLDESGPTVQITWQQDRCNLILNSGEGGCSYADPERVCKAYIDLFGRRLIDITARDRIEEPDFNSMEYH